MSSRTTTPASHRERAAGLGLMALDETQTELLHVLDATFERWGHEAGARSRITPALLPVADLVRLGYYENFPHQAFLAGSLDLSDGVPVFPEGTDKASPEVLGTIDLALLPAACYGVYLDLEGTEVQDGHAVTVVGRCFRKEERYEGLRRLLGFHMREVVRLGARETADQHLAAFTERTLAFAAALDLPVRVVTATDPFYDGDSSKAWMQKLSPVKHEFVVDGLAIASTNVHRNFFGDRCSITVAGTGEAASTSCVAFGLERWVSVLAQRIVGDAGALPDLRRIAADS